ncbi:hypothetical protein KR044_010219 [Drosophila immigrans]|nr:hypothetical protein KR044_010219 [Drosophila immigrans]
MACTCEVIGLACVVALILSISAKAPYQMRMCIVLVGAGAIVMLCIPFMILRPRDYRNGLVPSWCFLQLCKLMGISMEVRGVENVKREHGSVVLMNHQSALDLCVLAYLWPVIGRPTVVAKKEILYFPFFGVGAWLWGTLYINRSRKSDSINSLQKEAVAIKERNCKILVFPEGTRNSKETLLPFKKGSFHIALQSKCTIQPVVISKYPFFDEETKAFRPGHALINILPEISTEGYEKEDMEKLIEVCRSTMQREYTRLTKEAQSLALSKATKKQS